MVLGLMKLLIGQIVFLLQQVIPIVMVAYPKHRMNRLNLAFHVGDEPKHVRENRAIIAEYLGVEPDRISCGNQVHGLKAVEITEELVGAGAFGEDTAIADCDAVIYKITECTAIFIYC